MDYKDIFDLILDENDFTVGGGCTSAISGAMACGLMAMVANLSKGKDYGYTDEKYEDTVKELNEFKNKFLKTCVDDNKAYLLIKSAYKMSKQTDEEKKLRKHAIQDAGVQAAKVPLLNAKMNKIVNNIGKDLLKNSNPACITDLQAGIDLSKVGLDAGIANVKVNLPLIKDEDIIKEFEDELKKL